VTPLTTLLSCTTNDTQEARLPLTALDSSYRPCGGHAYERMPLPPQQQQHHCERRCRSFDEGCDNDDDDSENHMKGNMTSALELQVAGAELRVLPIVQRVEGM